MIHCPKCNDILPVIGDVAACGKCHKFWLQTITEIKSPVKNKAGKK